MDIFGSSSSSKAMSYYRYHLKGASDSIERLSNGSKESPGEDAGGLVVSSKFQPQVTHVDSTRNNIANSLSMVQTADGYLQKITKALQRMDELATLSMDNTKTSYDKQNYNTEFQGLKSYIEDITTKTMNTQNLFDGSSQSVTKDGNGNYYSFNNTDLTTSEVTNLTSGQASSTNQWETTIDLWKVTKPGFIVHQDTYKTTEAAYEIINTSAAIWRLKQDMWYTGGGTTNWSTTNNGGTKYEKDSFIKLGTGSGSQDIQSTPYWTTGTGYLLAEEISAAAKYVTKTNPLAEGNLEAGDVRSIPAGTYIPYDPTTSSDPPATTAYTSGSFVSSDPGLGVGQQTAVSAGDYITVDPGAEDPAATYYAASSIVNTDPRSADPAAVEKGFSHVITSSGALTAIGHIKTMLDKITTDRGTIGSVISRLQRMNEQMSMLKESLNLSVSRMTDTNMALESTRFARHQILVKSSVDMVDKARLLNQNTFRLLVDNF